MIQGATGPIRALALFAHPGHPIAKEILQKLDG